MDFLQFLKKTQSKKVIEKKAVKEIVKEKVTEEEKAVKEKVTEEIKVNFVEYKNGDFISIVYLKGSQYNYYKGYNGEIKKYIKNGNNAHVMLEACNSNRLIQFPISHFTKRYLFQ